MSTVLAQQELLDHYKFPQNKKNIEHPTFTSEQFNPSCGDRISMTGIVIDGRLTDLGFQGTGCVLSLAAASMLSEVAIGKTTEEILALSGDTMRELVGITLGPTRLKCALLALQVLQKALAL